jgi:Tol biopolymer transport system component
MVEDNTHNRCNKLTRRRSLNAFIGAVAIVAIVAPAALATPPGPNGRITFMREDASGFLQVWTSNPDLTAAQQLTGGLANSGVSAWTPDASRIAFDSDRTDPDPTDDLIVNDVFTMRADGSDVTKLTDSVGFSGDPAVSPDGALIVFDADRGVTSGGPGFTQAFPDLSVYVMDAADGHAVRRITTPPSGSSDSEPRFSPDGTAIVFTRWRGGHSLRFGRLVGDTSAVFVVNLDGTGLCRITGWGARSGQVDWSPDGSRIVFENVGDYFGSADAYTVRPDGSGLENLTHGRGIGGGPNSFHLDGFYDPVWSPDGTKVLLGHGLLGADGLFREGLAVINADGSNLDWVAPEVHVEHQPDWGTAPLQ